MLAAPLLSQHNPPRLSIQSIYQLALSNLKSHVVFSLKGYHIPSARRTIDFTLKTLTADFTHKLSDSLLSVEFDRHRIIMVTEYAGKGGI